MGELRGAGLLRPVRSAGIARARARQRPFPESGKRPVTCCSTVGLAGFSLNPALASYLHKRREAVASGVEPVRVEPIHAPVPKRRPVSVRLSEAQTAAIVECYRSGETARS